MSDRRSLKQAAKDIEQRLTEARHQWNAAGHQFNTASEQMKVCAERVTALQTAYDLVKPAPRGRKAAKPSAAPVSV